MTDWGAPVVGTVLNNGGLGACVVANSPSGMGEAMINMRIKGKSWQEIADEFNLGSPSAARAKFKKLTGITDFKIKGAALDKLVKNNLLDQIKGVAEKKAKKAVLAVDDVLKKQADHIEDLKTSFLQHARQASSQTLDIKDALGASKYESMYADYFSNGVTSYLKLSQKYAISLEDVDNFVWHNLVKKYDGDVWKAYAAKPTSEFGFEAIKQQVFDLRAKGWTLEEIADATGIPKAVSKLIIDGKWSLPAPGSTTYVGKIVEKPISHYSPLNPQTYEPKVIFEGPVTLGDPPFPIRSVDEMNQWMAQFGNDLTPAQYSAYRSYTGGGYRSINTGLRNGSVGDTALAIDAGMRPMPFDITVVRNCGSVAFGGDSAIPGLGGSIFSDKGFLSTTIKPSGVFSGNVQMIIEVPAGSQARWVSNGLSSVGNGEQEVVLARNTKMLVQKIVETGSNYGGKSWKIYLRVVAS